MMKLERLLKNRKKPYMYGDDVRLVQQRLVTLGYLPNGEIDGYYGPDTEKAVKAFQKAKGLKSDGIVGAITWGALEPVCVAPVTDTIQSLLVEHAAASAEREDIYASGGQGQTGTALNESWISRMEKSIVNRLRVIKLWKKRKAEGRTDIRAYDCSGLIIELLIKEGYTDSDTNANGIYFNLCHAIGRADLQAGDVVGKSGHIGVYMGDGTVVHAKGRAYGVIRESINNVRWTRYGRLK